MKPILSIIIPCYNAAATLETTLESVVHQNFQDWEAIIVNDGSTDISEEIALRWVKKDKRFKYYTKQNEGLGKTRNYGIARSNGLFILPLDSDNQLMKDFSQDAINVFEINQDIGVVYGDAEYFGERKGLWRVQQYDFKKILAGNYIDACAIYRKEFWVEVGGYDENMPHQGHEDWDFWIALGVVNIKFHHLNKITFKYFVSKYSMIRSFTDVMEKSNNDYIFNKYSKQYQKSYRDIYSLCKKNESKYIENLKSEKFVIDLFLDTFLGFTIFKNKFDKFE
jgi:glycosyltransferase involved in cell wall biosynthesis